MGGKDTHDKSTVEFIMWTLTLGPVSFLASCCYSTLGPISHVIHSYLSLRKEKAQCDDSRWLSCITLHCTTLHFKGVIYRHPTLIKRRPICPGDPLQLFSRGDACFVRSTTVGNLQPESHGKLPPGDRRTNMPTLVDQNIPIPEVRPARLEPGNGLPMYLDLAVCRLYKVADLSTCTCKA
jgi:hypothetical protein